jgi:glycosyltransferase involved in cell wall biosynthesis
MIKPSSGTRGDVEADVCFIMPCYNEGENVGYTVPKLLDAFAQAGHRIQLITVNNGSADRTGEALAELAGRFPQISVVTVERNIGYGFGVLSGLPHAAAPWIGTVAADGQVDAEDVVRLYEAVSVTRLPTFGKVRRRFRMDGSIRKVISVGYNVFVHLLWPGIGSLDVNGNPRLLPRDVVTAMELQATNWFLDPEMLIKAHYMGVRILELNVFARMRGNGLSHVRASTCWEFFRALLQFRFSRDLDRWRHSVGQHAPIPVAAHGVQAASD